MVPSQQPALTLVASAATEDPGRQLPSSAIATENQVTCMKSTPIDRSIASSSGTVFKYIYPHFSAPAQESVHPSQPTPARTTEELSSLPVASINPLKMDAAPSAAAGPPEDPHGSDGSTGSAPGSGSETRSLQTTDTLGEAPGRGTSTVSVLGETLGRCTPKSEENLRGSDCSRLLGTASALGEAFGSGTLTASVLGEALGSGTPTSKRNPHGSDGPSRERAPARGPASKETRFPSSSIFFEQRPVSSPLSPRKSRHTSPTKLSPSSARHVSHLARRSPNIFSFPHVLYGDSLPARRADLNRADPLNAQDAYSLERSSRMGEQNRIEGAAPAGRVEGQEATP